MKPASTLLYCLLLLVPATAFAGPRDAEAVLNRCGKPLKGDDTVLDNSAAGGYRLLRYSLIASRTPAGRLSRGPTATSRS